MFRGPLLWPCAGRNYPLSPRRMCVCCTPEPRRREIPPLTDRPTEPPPTLPTTQWPVLCECVYARLGGCLQATKKNVAVVCALFYKTIRKKEKMQSEVSLAAVSSARARARATKDGLTFEACSLSSLSRALSGRSSSSAIKCIIFFPQNKIKKKKPLLHLTECASPPVHSPLCVGYNLCSKFKTKCFL